MIRAVTLYALLILTARRFDDSGSCSAGGDDRRDTQGGIPGRSTEQYIPTMVTGSTARLVTALNTKKGGTMPRIVDTLSPKKEEQ